MIGVITTKDVIKNAGLIYREFGLATLLRCAAVVLRGKTTTFLEVACAHARR